VECPKCKTQIPIKTDLLTWYILYKWQYVKYFLRVVTFFIMKNAWYSVWKFGITNKC
jgi:hypothetical protein